MYLLKILPRLGFLPRSKKLPPSDIFNCFVFALIVTVCGLSVYGHPMLMASAFGDKPEVRQPNLAAELRVFNLVNDERVKNGARPLIWNEKAALAAKSHSDNMAESSYLSHSDLFGKKTEDRVEKYGLTDWRRLGENIAWISGYADPLTRVVECWLNSPGHRDNMLNPKFRESGIGMTVTSDGKSYFTQVFVSR